APVPSSSVADSCSNHPALCLPQPGVGRGGDVGGAAAQAVPGRADQVHDVVLLRVLGSTRRPRQCLFWPPANATRGAASRASVGLLPDASGLGPGLAWAARVL